MISIVDYGMGNLMSVQNALKYLGLESVITNDPDTILNSDRIILPGVGAFPDAIKHIREIGMDKILKKAVTDGTPLLGICLGMQLLFEKGYEGKECEGLGFLKGKIVKLEVDYKVPHMGWNSLNFANNTSILKDVKEGSFVYFVHSYYAEVEDKDILNAFADYGVNVPGVVSSGNVYGIQFHPEKSGDIGLQMLKNFGEMIK